MRSKRKENPLLKLKGRVDDKASRKNVLLRTIKETDLEKIWELAFKEDKPEWKKWDAPYYPHQSMSFEEFSTL